jgi:hypothetical protein
VGTATQSQLIVSNLSTTTIYRAVVQSGSCSVAYSNIAVVSVIPPYVPTPVIASPSTICLGMSSILTTQTGYPMTGISSGQGDFHNANPDGWRKDGQSSGNFLPSSGSYNGTQFPWLETTNTGGSVNNTIGGIDFSSPDPKFAMVAGNNNSILETPVFSLIGQTTATFDFIQSYNFVNGATGTIEISIDGGNSYSTILNSYSGQFGVSGSRGIMQSTSIPLVNYIGMSNLRIRFKFNGTTNSAWALDGLNTPGASLPISYVWGAPATLNRTDTTTVVATPVNTGVTTYTINTTVGGCPGGSQTINVNVLNGASFTDAQKPTSSTVCVGDVATFTGTPSGDNLAFTWQMNRNGGGWANVPASPYSIANGANSSILTVPTDTSMVADSFRLSARTMLSIGSNQEVCNAVSAGVPMKLRYVWKGQTSTDWGNPLNWYSDEIPSLACDSVYVLSRPYPYQPTINAGYVAPTIKNLNVYTNGVVTILGKLQIAGHIFNYGTGTLVGRNGSLNMNGTKDQSIDANTFRNNDLNNLNLDNDGVRIVTLNGTASDTLKLYGVLSFTGGGAKNLVSNGRLTLRSLATSTARVADLTNGSGNDI